MKLFIITKRQIIICICSLLVLTGVIVGSLSTFAESDRLLPIYCVETDKKQVAISFDAAWGCDDTNQLIEILKEHNVPATFFVVGAWVDKYPEAVKALHNAGHQIQNHSNAHPNMPQLSTAQMRDEIESCNKKIESITGICPTLFRPPYGDYNNQTIKTLTEMNMYTIQWDVDSLDWKDTATPDSICKRVISKVKNGSIVLFHNDAEYTPEALPRILKTLKNDGYEFVFISDLIYKENYEIKHDGTQCELKDGAE